MRNAILTHARFQRPPVVQKRRRGRLPGAVAFIPTGADRLEPGTCGELVFKDPGDPDYGKRVRIVAVDLRDSCPVHVRSLDGPLRSDDGTTGADMWVKPQSVRRAWTGLTENERIRLRLLRGAT